jgi:hypothetical protein
MKYYPLDAVDQMELMDNPLDLLESLKKQHLCDNSATIEDLEEYVYGLDFFKARYIGKFDKWNYKILTDETLNKLYIPIFAKVVLFSQKTKKNRNKKAPIINKCILY